ncbi:MAG TPA: PIN domain-containing protein [Candidatus Kapabacteria bacterium]|nr:PIN domain-containing protein [Candidatus Kapabacteria bacterium]
MGFVSDKDVLINAERQRSHLADLVRRDPLAEYFISAITVSELFHGFERASNEKQRTDRRKFLDTVLSNFRVLPIDTEIAKVHATIWADLVARNEMIGLHDSWIAATCIYHGHSLITLNRRDFERVRGLNLA